MMEVMLIKIDTPKMMGIKSILYKTAPAKYKSWLRGWNSKQLIKKQLTSVCKNSWGLSMAECAKIPFPKWWWLEWLCWSWSCWCHQWCHQWWGWWWRNRWQLFAKTAESCQWPSAPKFFSHNGYDWKWLDDKEDEDDKDGGWLMLDEDDYGNGSICT